MRSIRAADLASPPLGIIALIIGALIEPDDLSHRVVGEMERREQRRDLVLDEVQVDRALAAALALARGIAVDRGPCHGDRS